eukprot:CAMPEP_0204181556 /NCGR_PEP_ID=MMETSP0361-20130328/52027_1 /ASSEMBLY_ACC=CAM_ASM_000343 /TAXON_ID=268821 /ORGANISM="Scrippsiella Hangoei, Strain SHTV-5" /LENGTH=252 /DNA_ID=CAMNT_0051141147 /DNA_START=401 /DNA_END=1158 /DNA_ORIENTATION=-
MTSSAVMCSSAWLSVDPTVLACYVDDHQVHDQNVQRQHAESHARELAVHKRQHLAHSRCSTSRRGPDVLRGATVTKAVLDATGRAVHCELCGHHGMHCSHHALEDTRSLMYDLPQGHQAVRGAAGVGEHGVQDLVLLVVHTYGVDGHVVFRGRGDGHLLGTALQMQLGPRFLHEDIRKLADVASSGSATRDVRRVLLVEDLDLNLYAVTAGKHAELRDLTVLVISRHDVTVVLLLLRLARQQPYRKACRGDI